MKLQKHKVFKTTTRIVSSAGKNVLIKMKSLYYAATVVVKSAFPALILLGELYTWKLVFILTTVLDT